MPDPTALPSQAPRILIVMADQWPRALLRAALREAGYDAIGTQSLSGALAYPAHDPDRGAVGAIVIDWSAVDGVSDAETREALAALLQRHGVVPVVLLGSAVHADPPGPWTRVVRRPFSIDDVVGLVGGLVTTSHRP